MDIDMKGNAYKDVQIPDTEGRVRLTYVENGWAGTPGIRIQMRDVDGHLQMGPEIPEAAIGDMVGALVNLLAVRVPA